MFLGSNGIIQSNIIGIDIFNFGNRIKKRQPHLKDTFGTFTQKTVIVTFAVTHTVALSVKGK